MASNTIFNTGKYSLFATRRPYGRLQLVKKTFCHSEERSDVRIRNLLAANLHENARIVRFGNGLPRQSVPQGHLLRGADWLAMTRCVGADDQSLPLRGRWQREALTEGETKGGVFSPPQSAAPTAPSQRGPNSAAAPRQSVPLPQISAKITTIPHKILCTYPKYGNFAGNGCAEGGGVLYSDRQSHTRGAHGRRILFPPL